LVGFLELCENSRLGYNLDDMKVYIVIGTTEGVYQDEIGGNFVAHPDKEIVSVFAKQEDAENFVKNRKLKKPEKRSFGDTSHYKGGYYELEIEDHEVESR